jgi:hypothetical protein
LPFAIAIIPNNVLEEQSFYHQQRSIFVIEHPFCINRDTKNEATEQYFQVVFFVPDALPDPPGRPPHFLISLQ